MATDPPQAVFDAGPFLRTPEPFNLTDHTLRAGRKMPAKRALEVIGAPGTVAEAWSFGELEAAIRGTMTGLAEAGLRAGDRLLLRLNHSVDFPILFFAATGMGALPVPTSAQLTAPEVAVIAGQITPRLTAVAEGVTPGPAGPFVRPETYRAWRDLPPAEMAQTQADDPAYIVFTSGTGGAPQAVVHAHRAGWARRMMWRDWMDLRAADRVLHAGAFNWTYTLGTGLTDPWAAGATALIYAGPADRTVWPDLIHAHDASIFAAAPGVYRQMLNAAPTRRDWGALRHGLSAGDALPARIRNAWEETTATPLFEALGMTEVSTYASMHPGAPALRPQRGRRLAILGPDGHPTTTDTPGGLAISSRDPGLMLGYWRGDGPPQLPLSGEWFLTGDRAQLSADGTLQHLGRSDDLMNVQGYRVAPAEVEAALLDHPGVAEAAVLPVTVREDVDVIAAVVVSTAPITEESLDQHCAERLARYKCPRLYYFRSALPRTTTGKVVKRKLRDCLKE